MEINLSFIGVMLGIVLTFASMFLAARVLSFNASPTQLAVIAPVSMLTGLIPTIGWAISLASTYILLKKLTKEDSVLLMMIVSWIMAFALVLAVAAVL
jgi:hypothetical protein